ncbi:PilZ domain-containing protein [Sphingomonas sp. CARO-RG-8B-R24-01]|uniref:PilZ domain-containing protein n=1 Tax=Sphingomonas sp. CARO-RG-8B-R24-01 TaxID=2914831 RepID=UPI001F5A3549|nr:PilZ domain-containing protein [Sphingomonas sp. CARO-RG-8B-R24-01]
MTYLAPVSTPLPTSFTTPLAASPVSPPVAAPAAPRVVTERREDERYRRVLATGKLMLDDCEMFCFVRDLSVGGAKIETLTVPMIGQRLTFEMRGLGPCFARVVWNRGFLVGLAFDEPQDLAKVADRGTRQGYCARAPRFATNRLAQLRVAGATVAIELIDLSAGGARLRGAGVLKVDTAACLILDGIAPRAGYIRWARDGDVGLKFTPILDLPTLMQILT